MSAYDNALNLSLGYLDALYYQDQGSLPSHTGYVDVMDYQTPLPLRSMRFTKRPAYMTTQSLSDPTYGYVDVVDYQGYTTSPSGGFANKTLSRVTPHTSRYPRFQTPNNRTKMLAASANP